MNDDFDKNWQAWRSDWKPEKYVEILKTALDSYERGHPHWRIEVLVSIIQWSLRSLKHYVEDKPDSDISWESPFVELHYPIKWDWQAPRVSESSNHVKSAISFGEINKENTSDKETAVKTLAEIMVRQLNAMALGFLTNDVLYEIKNNYYIPILPLELSQELNAIKGKRAQRQYFEELVRPFSIGAASIDYSDMDFSEGARVPKRVAKQLENIQKLIDIKRIGINGDINGRKIEMSLIFQVHPMVVNYDKNEAYYPVTVGLFFEPRIVGNDVVLTTPADWSKNDREVLWRELLQEIDKVTDSLIPKEESQSSQILLVTATFKIPLHSSNPNEKNQAQQKALETLQQTGWLDEITMKSTENERDTATVEQNEVRPNEKPAESFSDVVRTWILKSRFRLPAAVVIVCVSGVAAVYVALPDEAKLDIWHFIVKLIHVGHR